MSDPFYVDHANLTRLVRHMADNGYDADQIAYAVEKPWKHVDVWQEVLTDDEFDAIVRRFNQEAEDA